MNVEAKKTILCVLNRLEYRAGITAKKTKKDVELLNKQYNAIKKEQPKKLITTTDILRKLQNIIKFSVGEKIIKIYPEDIKQCNISFDEDLKEILKIFKKEKIISLFLYYPEFIGEKGQIYYGILLPKNFNSQVKKFKTNFADPELPKDTKTLKEFWWILQKIKEELFTTTKGMPVSIIIESKPIMPQGAPSLKRQAQIIERIEEWKAIKILESPKELYSSYGKEYLFKLKIFQEKFNEIYKLYKSEAEKHKESINKTIANTKKLLSKIKKAQSRPDKIIEKLITRGIGIKNQVIEIENNPHTGYYAQIAGIHNQYKKWENDIKILKKFNLDNIDISFLDEKSALPSWIGLSNFKAFKGSFNYAKWGLQSNPLTKQAQNLLQNLKNETEKRLNGLRGVKQKINTLPKKSSKQKPIFKIPKNAKWDDIKIQFMNSQKLKFYYKKQLLKRIDNSLDKIFTKRELEFLKQLAIIQNHNESIKKEDGTISEGCSEFHPNKANIANALKCSENNCETIKSRLVKKLKTLFINSDPFYPYSKKDCYETIFKLEPETILKDKNIFMPKTRYANSQDLEKKTQQDNFSKNEAQRKAINSI